MASGRRLESELVRRRHREFFGRAAELAVFRRALSAKTSGARVFYVSGSGGLGKTSLLHELAFTCRATRVPCAYFDVRHVEPTPESFTAGLRRVLGRGKRTGRQVLLIDSLEAIAPLERWFVETFLPALPISTLVVLAGRHETFPRVPSAGWRGVVRELALQNFSTAEAKRYLRTRRVPPGLHDAALAFAHGHPLALALLADHLLRAKTMRFEAAGARDVLAILLETRVDGVTDPVQRAALGACAVVRTMTEPLLGAMLDRDDVEALFRWLAKLPFIDVSASGLYPLDSAREVFAADLRWRAPEQHACMLERAQAHYLGVLRPRERGHSLRLATDIVFLHRHNPLLRPLTDWAQSKLGVAVATAGDDDAILAIIEKHEGVASAAIAAHWLARQPDAFLVIRDDRGGVAGFTSLLDLEQATRRDIDADPGARAAWRYLRQTSGLRAGHATMVVRFAMARDTYQEPSPVMTLASALSVHNIVATYRFAFGLRVFADVGRWAPVYRQLGCEIARGAEFRVGERTYGMFALDFRELSPSAWLDGILRRSEAASTGVATLPPLRAMDRPAFSQALRDALRAACDPHALATNPLVESRLVAQRVGADATPPVRAAALAAIVRDEVTALDQARHAPYRRALEETYLRRTSTQEQVAERLGIPFRTYRDHLVKGIAELVERTWQRERGAV